MANPETEPPVFPNRFADVVGPRGAEPDRDHCRCVEHSAETRSATVVFHTDRQDTDSQGWQHLLTLIDEAAADGRTVFKPFMELDAAERRQIVTLPPTIAKLTEVKRLVLYGTNVVRIPWCGSHRRSGRWPALRCSSPTRPTGCTGTRTS